MSSPLVDSVSFYAREMGEETVVRAQRLDPTGGKIAPYIYYTVNVAAEGEVDLTINVNTAPGAAPMGRAFEYGSGIHSTRQALSPRQFGGPQGKYIIAPKNAPQLVFPGTNAWEGMVILVPPMGRGIVRHPGVEPRPYLHPAIEATRIKFKREMAKGLMDEIKIYIHRSFEPISGSEMIG